MTTLIRRMLAALAALALVAVATSSASAQFFLPRYYGAPAHAPVLTNLPLYAGGPTISQYSYNIATLGRAISQVPPYALGYNPYPQVVNYGPSLNTLGGYGGLGYGAPFLGAGGYGGAGLATPYGAGVADPSLATNPYGGGYGGYGYDPYGGALRGVADVTTANAQGVQTLQKARITSQQANQAALDTRRRIFDELRYERANTPGAEDLRLRDMEIALRRARNDPPMTEIFSGRSLNDLISHLANQQAKGLKGPDIRLNEELLKHINLTNGSNGNAGLLRNGGKLNWPLPLQGKEFEDAVKAVNVQFEVAARTAEQLKPVEASTLKDLKAALDKLNEALDNANGRLTPSEYIESKRFLNMLGDAYRALQDPDVGNYFKGGTWTARGNTVAEFINYLTRTQGLRVAPASPGDEPYYRALQAALVNYDSGITLTANR